MNKDKRLELVRKHNSELTKQVEDLRFQLDYKTQLNSESYDKAKQLICELEAIKDEWIKCLAEVEKQREKYDKLISELKDMKKMMKKMGPKIPLYRKFKNK